MARSMMGFGELGRPSSQPVLGASTAQGSKRTDLPHVLDRAERYAGTILRCLRRRRVAELKVSVVHPHPVHDKGELAGDRDARLLGADALGALYAPCAQN